MNNKILKIYDDDYGCEGVPEDQESMCSLLIQDSHRAEHWIKLSDEYLTENNLNEDDTVELSIFE